MALRWDDVNLAEGVIPVSRSWDEQAGPILPKSDNGTRRTPILAALRDHLLEAKTRTGRAGDDRVFGRTANEKRAERQQPLLVPIGLHECRHTCVSIFSAAGIGLERIGVMVGHSTTYMTDRYRHLLAGQLDTEPLDPIDPSQMRRLADAIRGPSTASASTARRCTPGSATAASRTRLRS